MDSAIAPFVALVAFALFHQKGIGMIRDGWALWEGAVSLVAGHGYIYFSGNPIIAWPPLYSAYMALWIIFLGPTGWCLMVSNGLLIVLQAFLWNNFMRTLARQSGVSLSAVQSSTLSVFLGLFIAVQLRSALSYNLLYVFLSLYLGALWRCFRATDTQIKRMDIFWVCLFGTALMLTHNMAITFVIAGCAVVTMARAKRQWPAVWKTIRWSFLWAMPTLDLPVLIWYGVRAWFQQTGSHYIGWGAGKYTPLEYAQQFLVGTGNLLMFNKEVASVVTAVLLVVTISLMCRDRRAVALRFSALFVGISSMGLYGLFSVTWIYGIIANTYILFVPLMLVPVAYITALSFKNRVASNIATGIAIAALVPLLYWTGMGAFRQYTSSLAELDFPNWFASPEAYISPTYHSGPPVITPEGVLMPSSTEEEPRGRRM
jgi:hypothetical protein